jgi:hypothetical protein
VLKEDQQLRMFEKRVLRRMFGLQNGKELLEAGEKCIICIRNHILLFNLCLSKHGR